ncbi:MAG: hypothetical protein JST26_12220 [Bacteroidetes bacterium]|nr:hypothetical protein [Bacteroidota bacterium]
MKVYNTKFKFEFQTVFIILLFLTTHSLCSYSLQKSDSAMHLAGDTLKQSVRNTTYIELAGNAGYYSFNYERLFPLRTKIGVSARIGYSLSQARPQHALLHGGASQLIPIELSFLLGKTHKLETGIGYTPLIRTYRGDFYDLNNYTGFRVGYRYQPPKEDFFFKVGVLLARNIDPYISRSFITAGIAFGHSF